MKIKTKMLYFLVASVTTRKDLLLSMTHDQRKNRKISKKGCKVGIATLWNKFYVVMYALDTHACSKSINSMVIEGQLILW